MSTAEDLNLPALMPVADFAARVGLSESKVRALVRATKPDKHGWQPIRAKRYPDGQLRITAADAAAWINSLPNA